MHRAAHPASGNNFPSDSRINRKTVHPGNSLSNRYLRLALLLSATALPVIGLTDSCPGEIDRAQANMRYFNENWPLRTGDEITAYVERLGAMITQKAIPKAPYQWRFIVVRDYAIHAIALGDGHIMVTDGVITALDNESEVAAVLAHEMGHQIAGHLCELPESGFFSGSNGIRDKNRIKNGLFTQVYDLDKEIEADRAALKILDKAGYDPFAMLQVLKKRTNGQPNNRQNKRISALRQWLYEGYYAQGKKSQLGNSFNKLKQTAK